MAVAVVWIWAAIVSALPWLGWNTWLAHDARCHLSTLWPLSFTTFVTFLVAVHMALALLMWASARAGTGDTTSNTTNRHTRLQGSPTPPQSTPPLEGGGDGGGAAPLNTTSAKPTQLSLEEQPTVVATAGQRWVYSRERNLGKGRQRNLGLGRQRNPCLDR